MQKGLKIMHIFVYCYILSLKRENSSLVMVLSLEEENKLINLVSCLNQKVGTHGLENMAVSIPGSNTVFLHPSLAFSLGPFNL